MTRPMCENEDSEIFFPEDDEYTEENTWFAKELCSICPVKQWCRDTYFKEKHGVFFGTTPKERKALWRASR